MKEIRVKMYEVVAANNVLQLIKDVEMSLETSIALCSLSDSLENQYIIYSKENKKLLDKYGKKDDKGEFVQSMTNGKPNGQIELSDPKKFFEGMEKLGEVEVPVLFDPVKLEGFKPTLAVVKGLYKFLVKEEKKEEKKEE